MKTKSLLLMAVVCLAAAATAFAADDPMMGSWKLNEAKSKITAGSPKNSLVVYTMDGGNIKCAIDGTDGTGQAYHSEWTGKFDGKMYAVKGDPSSDMRSYKMLSAHAYSVTSQKGGKTTLTVHVAISADGKSRTVTLNSTDAKGAKITSTEVFDKQ